MTQAQHIDLKIAVIIPAFNEGVSIGAVVDIAKRHAQVIVVNDGSADNTGIAAEQQGAIVINHPANMGYDQALKTGMHAALEKGFDFAITMDADGQHDPTILKTYIEEFAKGAEVIVGVRNKRQRVGESIFAVVGNILWKMKDPLCGMKGYKLSILANAGHFDTYKSIGTELAIRAVKSGYRLSNVPMQTISRKDASRFGGGWRPNYRILRSLVLAICKAPEILKTSHS